MESPAKKGDGPGLTLSIHPRYVSGIGVRVFYNKVAHTFFTTLEFRYGAEVPDSVPKSSQKVSNDAKIRILTEE